MCHILSLTLLATLRLHRIAQSKAMHSGLSFFFKPWIAIWIGIYSIHFTTFEFYPLRFVVLCRTTTEKGWVHCTSLLQQTVDSLHHFIVVLLVICLFTNIHGLWIQWCDFNAKQLCSAQRIATDTYTHRCIKKLWNKSCCIECTCVRCSTLFAQAKCWSYANSLEKVTAIKRHSTHGIERKKNEQITK